MPPTPFPQTDSAPGTNQDFILIVILLGLMIFFLVRSIGKFSGAGLKVSRPGRPKDAGDETTTAGEEEEDEEEEAEETEPEAEGAATKED